MGSGECSGHAWRRPKHLVAGSKVRAAPRPVRKVLPVSELRSAEGTDGLMLK